MRRGYNRAFSVSVRIAYGNYWRWDMRYLTKKPIKIDALRAGASHAGHRNFVPHSAYARQVYLPLFFFSPYCLRQLLALKLPNIGEKQVKNRRATRGKEKADFRKHKSVGETPYSTFIPKHFKNLPRRAL